MWKNKAVLTVSVACAVVLGLSACSVPDSSGAGSENIAANDSTLLGIVTISATDANNARVIEGATEAAEAAGWTVEVVDAAGNADQANTAIQNFVNKDAGMIFNLVFPASSLGAGLNAAAQANVPVATWGGGAGKGIVVVAGDGAPFAEPATNAMIDAIGGDGEVLALTYRTGQVCRDREVLFDEMMAEQAPDVNVTKNEVNIPGFLQDGARYATAWLAAHPEGSGNLAVWGCWEDPTLGAISAIKQQGRTDILTYGINGSSTAIQAVQDGTLTATVFEDARAEGRTMFEETAAAIESGDFSSRTVDVPGILVSADNIDDFLAEHPEALD
ncbi:sugar ABC transporter substrate-binding protein [Microbacterium sp. CH12i]|uniref:sugar ABC transporter substrate-binding protein n=1 Tax=Microbacterium sp. CH12i TaxID=1479651 RepID=UPI000461D79B|nr:sugar ABC transporter substrate-binding protein [Microbacterium sp. CH12i]KDA06831.1 sugar ABC transporter substrate-binding protein [Microbacterium sp. CH12i]